MEDHRIYVPYTGRPHFQGIPSQVIFRLDMVPSSFEDRWVFHGGYNCVNEPLTL